MSTTIQIDGVDKTSIIEMGSVRQSDILNQKVDTLEFVIIYHDGQTFRPEVNSEVKRYEGATKKFGGKVHRVNKKISGNGEVRYKVSVMDYSYDLDRQMVVEGYQDKTVNYIINDILTNFTDGTFTDTNVDCDITITKITFDRISVIEALQKLADLTGYSFYIDYDKDVHFFEKNTETAPFNITDADGNHIPQTLEITDDFSQIRNRVFIKGGEIEGNERAETFDGDGVKEIFKLGNKFAEKPTVEVGGVAQNVGVDFLDDEASFDCFWDYKQKYIRFKTATVPASGTNNVEISGIPLYNLVVQVEDPDSILEHGLFEFAKIDKKIQSREEAVRYGQAEIEAYKNGLIEGSFETYESGLRSGQVININSSRLNVNENFLIQSVGFTMIAPTQYKYKVKLATLRTIGIIDFLIDLLKSGDRLVEESGDTILEKTAFKTEAIEMSESVDINTDDYPQTESIEMDESLTVQAIDYPIEFVAGPATPTGYKRVAICDGSRAG